MRQPGMCGAGVYKVRQSHLLYIAQPLKPFVVYHPYQLRLRESYETINRVIDDLYFNAH